MNQALHPTAGPAPADSLPDRREGCALCRDDGGQVIHRHSRWRVVWVDDLNFPGFTRVIWQAHRREMTDLLTDERDEIMRVVLTVETLMRQWLNPDKINLASLGNEVDHVHWHVIPRWRDDSHFPRPIWAQPPDDRRDALRVDPVRLQGYRDALTAGFGHRQLSRDD